MTTPVPPGSIVVGVGVGVDGVGANLKPLPDEWAHGEPLRVGDKATFSGCDAWTRERLEKESEHLGVRIMNNVSSKTAMLVTDRTMDGTELVKATELDTRIVHPDEYRVLLAHLQPAHVRRPAVTPADAVAAGTALVEQVVIAAPAPAATDQVPTLIAATSAVVRVWAKENGWEVGVRGRLPKPLLDAYAAAQAAAPVPMHSALNDFGAGAQSTDGEPLTRPT